MDDRKLNDITVKNKYHIPMVEDLLDGLCGLNFFLQIRSSFGLSLNKEMRLNRVQNPSRAVGISCHAFWAYKCPDYILGVMHEMFAPYLQNLCLFFSMIF